MVPNESNVPLCAHFLCAESTSGLLVFSLVQEIISKASFVFLQKSGLLVVLHCSKVNVIFNLHGVSNAKSRESIVPPNLVLIS